MLCFRGGDFNSASLTRPLEAWVKQRKEGHCYSLCAQVVHRPGMLIADFYIIINRHMVGASNGFNVKSTFTIHFKTRYT